MFLCTAQGIDLLFLNYREKISKIVLVRPVKCVLVKKIFSRGSRFTIVGTTCRGNRSCRMCSQPVNTVTLCRSRITRKDRHDDFSGIEEESFGYS